MWLEFHSDGSVTESWDEIGELSVSVRHWFIENDELVLHWELAWKNDWTWNALSNNVTVLWARLRSAFVEPDRYRVRSIDNSALVLEPIDNPRHANTPVLRLHRGRTL